MTAGRPSSSVFVRTLACGVLAAMLFLLPLAFSLRTEQVFAIHKFIVFIVGTNVLLLLALLEIRCELSRVRRLGVHEHVVWMFLLLFLLLAGISAILGASPAHSFWGSGIRHTGVVFWLHLILCAGAVRMLQPSVTEQRWFILMPIIIAGLVQSMIAIIQWFDPHLLFSSLATDEFLGRSFGTLGHPSLLGQYMIFPIFAVVSQLKGRESRQKLQKKMHWMLVFSLIILLIGLLLSVNRASILGVFSGGLFLIFLHLRERWQRLRRLTLPLMTAAAVVMVSILFVIASLPSPNNPQHSTPYRSIHVRAAIWKHVPSMIAERPFFGIGLENVDVAFSPHMPAELLRLEKPTNFADSSHNVFFDLLVQTGILGTLAFVGFLTSVCMIFFRQRQTTWMWKSMLAGITGILISWQFGFPGIVDGVMFFVMSGLFLACLRCPNWHIQ